MTDSGSTFDGLVESVYAAAGDAPAWSPFIQGYVEVGSQSPRSLTPSQGKLRRAEHVA